MCVTATAQATGSSKAGTDSDWSAEKYGNYLARLRKARDTHDATLALDGVEYDAREFADK
ncbi:hypothetical protein V6D40_06170 [Corynebacterium sp. Q4381]|uniref:hypothetical protein n=1 Tax=Corynebacterium sp. Marseille-Q4381 TaxID=3121597 RepID=UPI002FE61B43